MTRSPYPVVAFQGARGAFSEEVVERIWGGEAVPAPERDFASVVTAVADGRADYGVLPVANTAIGRIPGSIEAMSDSPTISVVAEYTLPVSHCLLAIPGAVIENVSHVFSHPAALAQCQRFFAEYPGALPVEAYDTAGSAAEVALRADPAEAAIAPRGAATHYGLVILRADIQDDPDNATHFVVVASEQFSRHPVAWKRSRHFFSNARAVTSVTPNG